MQDQQKVLFLDLSLSEFLGHEVVAFLHEDDLDEETVQGLRVLEDAGFSVRVEVTVFLEDDGSVHSAYPTWSVTADERLEQDVKLNQWRHPAPGFSSVLNRSTRPGVRWQLTTFDVRGEPWGHTDLPSLDYALKDVGAMQRVVQVSTSDGVYVRKGADRLANPPSVRRANPLGNLPAKATRMWEAVYESAQVRGFSKSASAAQAWCAVKRRYYKKGNRWLRRERPIPPHQQPPGCTPSSQFRKSRRAMNPLPEDVDRTRSLDVPPYTKTQALEILSAADLPVGSGMCGETAIAINELVFAGMGEYVAAANKFLWRNGFFSGHVAVRVGSDVWDAEGVWENDPEPEEFLAWGMLDPADPEYGFDDEKDAYEVELLESLSENDIRAILGGPCSELSIKRKIHDAIAEVIPRDQRDTSFSPSKSKSLKKIKNRLLR